MSNAAVPSDVSEESASPAAAAPALEITDLRYRFRAREGEEPGGWLIDLPRLTVSAGEQMLLQAPSGRGKSTLLYLIAGLYDLDGPEAAPAWFAAPTTSRQARTVGPRKREGGA